MARRPTIDGFWDALTGAAADYIDQAAESIYRDFRQGLGDALPRPKKARIPSPTLKSKTPTLKRAYPMRIRRPKTWTQLCNWLAGLGLGNRYYQEEGPVTIADIQAITVHVVDKDGQPKALQMVLDPEWSNPWVNEDGTGPRRKL